MGVSWAEPLQLTENTKVLRKTDTQLVSYTCMFVYASVKFKAKKTCKLKTYQRKCNQTRGRSLYSIQSKRKNM